MIFRTPLVFRWLYPDLIWKIRENEKAIYLTFDDGPIPGPTEWVLDELIKVKALATFFCIGQNVKNNPLIFKRILAEGHSVGNHTFNHVSGWNCDADEYLENTRQCQGQLRESDASADGTKLFRPPYGRIKRSQIRALSDFRIVMWDVLSFDFSKRISRERCLTGSIAATRPGSIVVFHDSLKAEAKLKYILPEYLRHFSNQGYLFKTIPIR